MNEFARITNRMHAKIEKRLKGAPRHVYYSAYGMTSGTSLPIDNLNEVAIRGKFRVVRKHDSFWGQGRDYTSRTVNDPTWLTLAVIANESIVATGDYHHSFFEGFVREGDTLRLSFGS